MTLDASSNQLDWLPWGVFALDSLDYLDLSNNLLTELPGGPVEEVPRSSRSSP